MWAIPAFAWGRNGIRFHPNAVGEQRNQNCQQQGYQDIPHFLKTLVASVEFLAVRSLRHGERRVRTPSMANIDAAPANAMNATAMARRSEDMAPFSWRPHSENPRAPSKFTPGNSLRFGATRIPANIVRMEPAYRPSRVAAGFARAGSAAPSASMAKVIGHTRRARRP
jgi:hypothetical protein